MKPIKKRKQPTRHELQLLVATLLIAGTDPMNAVQRAYELWDAAGEEIRKFLDTQHNG